MECPACSGTLSRVVQTRRNPLAIGQQIIRKRVCQTCDQHWFTAEVPIPSFTVTQGSEGAMRSSAVINIRPPAAA